VARAVVLPKRFTILLFLLGLSAALIAAGYVTELSVMLLEELTGQASSFDATASLGMILVAGVLVLIMAKSARSITALLAGFVVGCLVRFVLMLPVGM
jgi:hypothetical protein